MADEPTANDIYADLMIGHQIGVIRRGGGIYNDLIPILQHSQDEREIILLKHLMVIEARGGVFDAQSDKQLEKLLLAYRKLRDADFKEFEKGLQGEMEALIAYEIDYQKVALTKAVPFTIAVASVDPERASAAIKGLTFPNNMPVIQRKNVAGWIDSMEESEARRIVAAISSGFATGMNSQQIAQNIMGQVSQLTRAHAETIVRTSTAAMAQAARTSFYEANLDISKNDVWAAVLDGRTTLICFGRDGKIKPRGYWQARYPAHMGERSTIIAVLDAVGIIGTRPTIRDTRTRNRREIAFRQQAKDKVGAARWKRMTTTQRADALRRERTRWAKEVIGTSPAEVTMEEWLGKQPVKFQKEYLGEARCKLFTTGGLKAGDFADTSGNIYNLEQLAKRDRQAFLDAGLNPDNF